MKNIIFSIILSLLSINAYADQTRPTIVLVHGALLTSSVWESVQSDLQNHGFNVVTMDAPGRVGDGVDPKSATLALAVTKLCKVINVQHDPVLLVGHSQAGAMITQATQDCGNKIKGLVYVTAVVPLPNETVFSLLSDEDNHNFDLAATLDSDLGVFIPKQDGSLKEIFLGNVSDDEASHAINNMVPEPVIFGEGSLHYDLSKFQAIPKFYIKTLQDKVISPATQDKYRSRIKFESTYVIDSGHSPFITHPHLLAAMLEKIAEY